MSSASRAMLWRANTRTKLGVAPTWRPHAALAFIVTSTGKSPKPHSGVRSEFARLARREPRISRAQVSLLGWSYELKNAADYGQERRVTLADAERAINDALRLIETIAAIVK